MSSTSRRLAIAAIVIAAAALLLLNAGSSSVVDDLVPATVRPRAPETASFAAQVASTSGAASVGGGDEAREAAAAALWTCRNMTNGGECALVRDAVVLRDGSILVPRNTNPDFARLYPQGSGTYPAARSRHHMRPVRITLIDKASPVAEPIVQMPPDVVGFYQTPVIGVVYVNVWHSLSDMFMMVQHTVDRLLRGPSTRVVWVSEAPSNVLYQTPNPCTSLGHCRRRPLFAAFDNLFSGRVMFGREGASPEVMQLLPSAAAGSSGGHEGSAVRFPNLLFGLNHRCSPIPDHGLEAPVCQEAMATWRRHVLTGLALADDHRVQPHELRCPRVHFMSRQKDKYRRIHNFDTVLAALRKSFGDRGCDADAQVEVVSLHGGMSLGAQVGSISNATILIAGRGGGTGYSPLLPRGGGYFSISGSDRWSPYRGLVPSWITLQHYRAKMTHEDDPNRPPRTFKGGAVDANRCGYVIESPAAFVAAFWSLVETLGAAPRA